MSSLQLVLYLVCQVPLANKHLVANLNDIQFVQYSLPMFTDENLARPNVKSTTKSAKREPDEVAEKLKDTEINKSIIALNNYRLIMYV